MPKLIETELSGNQKLKYRVITLDNDQVIPDAFSWSHDKGPTNFRTSKKSLETYEKINTAVFNHPDGLLSKLGHKDISDTHEGPFSSRHYHPSSGNVGIKIYDNPHKPGKAQKVYNDLVNHHKMISKKHPHLFILPPTLSEPREE